GPSFREECMRCDDVQAPNEKTTAIDRLMMGTRGGAPQEGLSHSVRVGGGSPLPLDTQQQGDNTRDNRGRKARATPRSDTTTWHCPHDMLARSQDALRLVCLPPVTKIERPSLCILRSYC